MQWRLFRRAGSGELEREIAFHLDEAARANQKDGMPAEEARRQANIAFGGREQTAQRLREVHTSALGQSMLAHARAALRFLRRSPSFSLAVILTLALGIGANTAVFSAIDGVLLRPLAFPQGDRLVALGQVHARSADPQTSVAPQRLEDWNRLNHTFDAISGYYTEDLSESSGPLPERLEEALVAPRFLEVWRVAPALGRSFNAAEEHFGGPSAALISDRLWRRHFGAAPDVAGKRLKLGTYSYEVIGVMPRDFAFPLRDVDVWTPSAADAPFAQSRESTWFQVVGRLRPGASMGQATADLAQVQQQLGRQYPKTDRDLRVTLRPLKSIVIGDAASSLWMLYGSVTLLLSIACINIAALLLARTAEREHEISVRFSLGASRRTILAQLLSETLALALAGALLGLLVAAGLIRVLHQMAGALPRAGEIRLHPRILLYTLGCALVAALLCGLLPAMRGARHPLARSLALGSRTQAAALSRLQSALVITQVAFAVMLLVGAGLLLRSFEQLGRVNAGFDPDHVLTLEISGSWGETANMGRLTQRMDRTLESLRGTPGVVGAATAAELPGVGGQSETSWKLVEGAQDPNHAIVADTRYVSAGYFSTLRIPLLLGQGCQAGDPAAKAGLKVLVNRSFAAAYLSGGDPLGRHLRTAAEHSFEAAPGQIEGVVADAREQGLNEPPTPTVYWCVSAPDPAPYFLIRTTAAPMMMADTLRRRIHAIEPDRAVYSVGPLEEHLAGVQAENRLRTTLLTLFAATAVALASVGIYGTLSYLGRLRRREMGVRLAVGATRWQVAERFLWQGLRIAGVGCCAGVLLGWLVSHLLAGMLYKISAIDPETYAGTIALVAVLALIASGAPALRAARINPVDILREE